MRQISIVIVVAAFLGAAVAASAKKANGGAPELVAPPEAAASILSQAKGYRGWARFSEYGKPKLSKAHEDLYVIGYYNQTAAAAVQSGGPFPRGAILVKENRPEPNAEPKVMTIMAMQEGGWYYIKASPDLSKVLASKGQPLAGPHVAGCVSCHGKTSRGVFSR